MSKTHSEITMIIDGSSGDKKLEEAMALEFLDVFNTFTDSSKQNYPAFAETKTD